MMPTFELILKNEKLRQYTLLAYLIIVLNALLLGVYAFYSASQAARINAITGIMLVAAFFIVERIVKKQDAGKHLNAVPGVFFLIIITWGLMLAWLPALINLLLLILYLISKRPLLVSISSSSVAYPSFPKKVFAWEQLNNVVLKDGLLTLDFKNNRILQAEINNAQKEINEQEFNDFCRRQLQFS